MFTLPMFKTVLEDISKRVELIRAQMVGAAPQMLTNSSDVIAIAYLSGAPISFEFENDQIVVVTKHPVSVMWDGTDFLCYVNTGVNR
jgi:hypothetical protein